MAASFQLRLVTPTGIVFEGVVQEVVAKSPLGQFGVLADHINFITSLVPGVLSARLDDGSLRNWVVSGGLAEVKAGVMTVLASGAEEPEDMDASKAAAEVQAADEKFSSLSFYDPDYAAANDALMLARAHAEAASLKNPGS
ncbi:MAG TPA: ATP synthase F1 subunit epsilon [Candidatus Acidoferrales bacterium]|nr:ATP synthase F1 subunit epsilon [Candidatus Acidoferrales bacterium]